MFLGAKRLRQVLRGFRQALRGFSQALRGFRQALTGSNQALKSSRQALLGFNQLPYGKRWSLVPLPCSVVCKVKPLRDKVL